MSAKNNQSKILVVVESIDVDDSSGSKANMALINNLSKAGFEVEVYHYTRKDIKIDGISTQAIKENRTSPLFFLSRAERFIRRQLKLSLNKYIEQIFGFSFTLYNDRNSIVKTLKGIDITKFDLVMTLSKGASFRPHHALLRMPVEWHKKWVAYIHDPYPFSCYPRPYDWVEPGHLKKRNFFKEVYKKAGYAAYPSLLLAEWMESYYPLRNNKRLIIPHQIYKKSSSQELPEFFDKNKFNLVHAGLLMGARNPKGLIDAYIEFITSNALARENSSLIIIGAPSQYSEYFNKIKQEVPQFYASEKKLDFECVSTIQQNASVNVILEAKAPISPFLPGKFPHCIEADKPILLLGPNISESHRLLGQDYPYWAEIDDVMKIRGLLEELFEKWCLNKEKKINRPDLEEYMSTENLRQIITNRGKEE